MWLLPSNRSVRPLVRDRPAAARRAGEGGVDEYGSRRQARDRIAPRSADCRRARRVGARRDRLRHHGGAYRLRAGCSPAGILARQIRRRSVRAHPDLCRRQGRRCRYPRHRTARRQSRRRQEIRTASSTGAIIPVKLTGTAGEGKSGIYDLAVQGLPPDIKVRVQTGPAINGTDLRDAPGDIAFGSFKNQIEYQNAGSGINRAMKKTVLDPLDTSALTGKTVEVTGAFRLINPKNWLITPVRLAVK